MTAEVIGFPGVTTLDTDPSRVLDSASAAGLEHVVVVGVDSDGEFYFASSMADGGDVLWWLAIAKKRLLEIGDK